MACCAWKCISCRTSTCRASVPRQTLQRETLEIRYKGLSIHEVLQMTVEQAFEFFQAVPTVARKLQTLLDVGLGYITSPSPHALRRRRSASSSPWNSPSATPAAPLHPRRTHHRPALPGHRNAAHRGASSARSRQHRGRHRTQLDVIKTPTGSSTSARKAATAAVRSSPKARRKRWRNARKAIPGNS